MTFDEAVRAFDAKPRGTGYVARCPAHDDRTASLSLSQGDDGRTLVKCFAGCTAEAVLEGRGLRFRDLFPDSGRCAPKSHIVATYDYREMDGRLRYQVVRFQPKSFRPRRPDGTGGWQWNLQGIERLPYRLNELKGRGTVFIVEGEKDADRLWAVGLPATCNAGGAGKWVDPLSRDLTVAGVTEAFVLPDNDDAGRAHAESVARSCTTAGIAVRIVPLPDIPDKGDTSDYLARHSLAELLDECERAPAYVVTAERPDVHPSAGHLSDTGNAARFARQHRGRVIHCFPMQAWFVYDGRVWRADVDGTVMRLAKSTVATIYEEASRSENRDKIGAWALKSESAERLNAMISLARSELAVGPDQLDADRRLLNCQNGTLDLRTRTLRPHRPEDYLTKIVPVAYDASAQSTLWTRVLETAIPDADVRRFIQKIAGMTCDGDTDDVLLVVFGPTRTAKGTFQDALASTLGDYAMTGELDLFAQRDHRNAGAPRPELVRLKGARMVSIYETSRRLKLSASLVKTATGNDPITARGLYMAPITFKPEATNWIATNHRPNLPSDDDAIWERVRELPFVVSIPPEARDPNVRAELRDPSKHGAAILAWMIDGHRLWKAEGIQPPAGVTAATSAYRAEMNQLNQFVADCCVLKATAWTLTAALRRAYHSWADENNEQEVGASEFQQCLRELGCVAEPKHAGRGWKGIGLLDPTRKDDDHDQSRRPPLQQSLVGGSEVALESTCQSCARPFMDPIGHALCPPCRRRDGDNAQA